MKVRDLLLAILIGILTSIVVFTTLNIIVAVFPIEVIISLHSLIFTIIGVTAGYLVSSYRKRKHP